MGQWLSLPMIVAGVMMLRWAQRQSINQSSARHDPASVVGMCWLGVFITLLVSLMPPPFKEGVAHPTRSST